VLITLELMSFVRRRLAVCALLAFIGLPATAQAQIHVWRDDAGNFVLSDKPQDPTAVGTSYAVSTESPFRTTKRSLSERAAQFDALIGRTPGARRQPHLVRRDPASRGSIPTRARTRERWA
jgi:hypothetical protein